MEDLIKLLKTNQTISLSLEKMRCVESDEKKFIDTGTDVKLTICEKDFPFKAVMWCPTPNIYISEIDADKDTISFNFQGCLMARYQNTESMYIAHIHRDNTPENDTTTLFCQNAAAPNWVVQTIFRPNCDAADDKLKDTCWGVISQNGECYTIIVEPIHESENGGEFRLKKIIHHIRRNGVDFNGTICDAKLKYTEDKVADPEEFNEMKKYWDGKLTSFFDEEIIYWASKL